MIQSFKENEILLEERSETEANRVRATIQASRGSFVICKFELYIFSSFEWLSYESSHTQHTGCQTVQTSIKSMKLYEQLWVYSDRTRRSQVVIFLKIRYFVARTSIISLIFGSNSIKWLIYPRFMNISSLFTICENLDHSKILHWFRGTIWIAHSGFRPLSLN